LKSIDFDFAIVSPFFKLPPFNFRRGFDQDQEQQQNKDSFFFKAGVYFCRKQRQGEKEIEGKLKNIPFYVYKRNV
jgi:hypothetical protein